MLLLDGVDTFGEDTVSARATVRADAWYADAAGAMPAWIGIELMAQTIAAHVALLAMRGGGTARPGVLLGSRSYRALQPSFAGGARLQIRATELLRSEEGHGAYECTIHHGEVCWGANCPLAPGRRTRLRPLRSPTCWCRAPRRSDARRNARAPRRLLARSAAARPATGGCCGSRNARARPAAPDRAARARCRQTLRQCRCARSPYRVHERRPAPGRLRRGRCRAH